MKNTTASSVVLQSPGHLSVKDIPVPIVPGDSVLVRMRACGICGSDIRYLHGENPWSQHTLGRNLPSPPNMVLGHEVSGVADFGNEERRVAILAYKSCGLCAECVSGNEHLCEDMMHFGHSAGWESMEYYPGGMTETFSIWRDAAVVIPENVGFDEAVFLDGLAVALHALETGGMVPGKGVCVLGLGPVGMLAALASRSLGAATVIGCDIDQTATRLAAESGIDHVSEGDAHELMRALGGSARKRIDIVIDTVGSEDTISCGLKILSKRGVHVLLAVHSEKVPFSPLLLNGERRLVTSANNRYKDFPAAIELLTSGKVRVDQLITHRFQLNAAMEAFSVMENKGHEGAFKVVLTSD